MTLVKLTDKEPIWLTSPWSQDDPDQPRRNPIFRKTVAVAADIDSATLDFCGLGHYELYINGVRVGGRLLEPAFTDYDTRIHYSTYNISSYLHRGDNVFALFLGRGRYNMNTISVWAFENSPWREQCRFTIAGDIVSGGESNALDTLNWRCTEGPIFRDSMYEGEGNDARLEPEGWQVSGFDDGDWDDAVETNAPKGKLQPTDMEPIRAIAEVPVSRTVFANSTSMVFEFPDMLAGNVRIRVKEPAGTRIQISYAECFDGEKILSKVYDNHITTEHFQEDEYICKGGGEETWQSRFSYTGFRYVEISGYTSEFTSNQVIAVDLHQDLQSRGSFRCSNDLINRIHHASRRSLLNNAHHIITDTPTYEKNGWTGDAQLTVTMGIYNFEIERFYRKFLTDLRDSQISSGELAPIVPTSGWGLTGNPNAEGKPFKGHMPAWDGSLFVIAWEIYQHTGNLEVIRENYTAMQKYLAFIESRAENYILRGGLGDWLPPGGSPSERAIISSTSWFYRLTGILEDCAILLDDEETQRKCNALKPQIFEAFNNRFLNDAGDAYETDWETEYRQTSAIQPLEFGLVPKTNRLAVFNRLKTELCKSGTPRLDTGILGTRYLLNVLADNGEVDLAYKILTGEDYPSWGRWFASGRVSLGEAWEEDARSWSHHMFGSVDAWFYQYLAGIRPVTPGFTELAITPHIPTDLVSTTASVNTLAGTVESSFKKTDGGYLFELGVPKGVKATFKLPQGVPGVVLSDHSVKAGVPLPAGKSSIEVMPDGKITFSDFIY